VVAARRPILGRVRVARHFAGLASKLAASVALSIAEVNGEPALLAWTGESLTAEILVDVVEDRIGSVRSIPNPDKLAFAARQGQQLSRARGPSGLCL
jgi:RNA polymerase sigma-70 factor (ECF subfamily)